MAIREISFKSYNKRDSIKGWVYIPAAEPRGIIQVVHGFGEHSRRYLRLIMRMLDAGFIVCADDHVGHGKTALENDTWGDYGFEGYRTTIEDEKTLHDMMAADYPELPYFLFGHSWGSMIARCFAASYGSCLTGLVLCGTASMRDGMEELRDKLKAEVDAGHAAETKPEYLGEMLGSFTSRYENVLSPNDWIATDPQVVKDHAADPFNNFTPPNVQALYDFAQMWVEVCKTETAAGAPAELPIYIIAGDQDPVGGYGEGVYHTANQYWNTGHNRIKTRLYSGYRHEIHNEPDIRDEVEAGIVEFIMCQLYRDV